MQLSDLALRIIFLFIPGIVSLIIIDNLTNHKEYKIYQILLYPLLLGFICYSFYFLLLIMLQKIFGINTTFSFFEALVDNTKTLDFKEIISVSGLSIITGVVATYMINHKVLHRIAQATRITKKYGDIDVWSYIMNSPDSVWVVVRDIEIDLMYEGWIEAFSSGVEKDELFLRDVIVFRNSTGGELYKIPGLYLHKNRKNLIFEFPKLEFSFKERNIENIKERSHICRIQLEKEKK